MDPKTLARLRLVGKIARVGMDMLVEGELDGAVRGLRAAAMVSPPAPETYSFGIHTPDLRVSLESLASAIEAYLPKEDREP